MRRTPLVLIGLLLLMTTAACGSSQYDATARPEAKRGAAVPADGLVTAESIAVDPANNPLAGAFYFDGGEGDVRDRAAFRLANVPSGQQPPARADRLLIHQGQVAVEVPRPEESIAAFLDQVAAWGGYMQSQVGTTVTVRIPAQQFDAAFESVRAAGRVLSEERRAQDVTEEYLDLEIRLGNARNARERLLAILEKAEKVEDILAIEKELRRLTDEIETMEGRRKYLADQVALATLRAEFRASSKAPPPKPRRRPSRFRWINLIGAERVMEDF